MDFGFLALAIGSHKGAKKAIPLRRILRTIIKAALGWENNMQSFRRDMQNNLRRETHTMNPQLLDFNIRTTKLLGFIQVLSQHSKQTASPDTPM